MQEEKLVELLDELMSTACDNCKKIEGVSQEKAEEICAGCPAGDHLCAILMKTTGIPKLYSAANANIIAKTMTAREMICLLPAKQWA